MRNKMRALLQIYNFWGHTIVPRNWSTVSWSSADFCQKNIISYGNKCAVTCVAYFYEHSIAAAYPFALFTYRRVQNLSNRQFPNFHWLDRNKMEKEFHLESKELLTKCVTPFCKWISIYRNCFLLKRRVCKNWGRKTRRKMPFFR